MRLLDLQYPPTRNGMKNNVLVRMSWNVCKAVVSRKQMINITAAAREGL